jgi:hypothetical protein
MATIDDRNANALGAASGHGGHHDEGSYLTPKGGLITTIWDWATTVDHKKIGVMYMFAVLMMFFFGGVAALAVRTELLTPVRTQQVQSVNPETGAPMVDAAGKPVMKAETTGQWLGSFLGRSDATVAENNNSTTASSRSTARSWSSWSSCPASPRAWATSSSRSCSVPRTSPSRGSTSSAGTSTSRARSSASSRSSWAASTPGGRSTPRTRRPPTGLPCASCSWSRRVHPRLQLDPHRPQLRRHGAQAPRPGHGLVRHAALRLGRLLDRDHPGARDAGHRHHAPPPHLRASLPRRHLRPRLGGDPVLFQHFFWFYSHPVVYVMILPGMGIISEIIAVHSHKKIFGYRAIAFASLGIAGVSFLVWGHHMFTSMGEWPRRLLGADLPRRDPHRRQGLQLDRHPLQGLDLAHDADGLRPHLPLPVHHRRPDRPPPGHALHRPPPPRLLLRRRPLPLRHDGRHDHRVRRRHPPLVAQDVRQDVQRRWAAIFGASSSSSASTSPSSPSSSSAPAACPAATRRTSTSSRSPPDGARSARTSCWLGFLVHLFVFIHSLVAGRKAPKNPWGGLTLEWEPTARPSSTTSITSRSSSTARTTSTPPSRLEFHWDPKD